MLNRYSRVFGESLPPIYSGIRRGHPGEIVRSCPFLGINPLLPSTELAAQINAARRPSTADFRILGHYDASEASSLDTFALTASATVRYGIASIRADFSSSFSQFRSDSCAQMTLEASAVDVNEVSVYLDDLQLKPEAAALTGNLSDFTARYGDEFVVGLKFGASVQARFRIREATQRSSQHFAASLQGVYKAFVASARLNASASFDSSAVDRSISVQYAIQAMSATTMPSLGFLSSDPASWTNFISEVNRCVRASLEISSTTFAEPSQCSYSPVSAITVTADELIQSLAPAPPTTYFLPTPSDAALGSTLMKGQDLHNAAEDLRKKVAMIEDEYPHEVENRPLFEESLNNVEARMLKYGEVQSALVSLTPGCLRNSLEDASLLTRLRTLADDFEVPNRIDCRGDGNCEVVGLPTFKVTEPGGPNADYDLQINTQYSRIALIALTDTTAAAALSPEYPLIRVQADRLINRYGHWDVALKFEKPELAELLYFSLYWFNHPHPNPQYVPVLSSSDNWTIYNSINNRNAGPGIQPQVRITLHTRQNNAPIKFRIAGPNDNFASRGAIKISPDHAGSLLDSQPFA